jgi:hypothetical protein
MVAALTTQAVHQLQNRTSESSDRSSSFSVSIVAALAIFGLAASGLCIAALTQPCAQVQGRRVAAR